MLQQMQEPEQVQKEKVTYSFEEICPDWNQILGDNGGFIKSRDQTFKNKDETHSIMNCATCIVGEAIFSA